MPLTTIPAINDAAGMSVAMTVDHPKAAIRMMRAILRRKPPRDPDLAR
ncbi:hypothetical protein MycrhN_4378 [Mycolicibacterium rhodesiae NBB3]|uniref:Uncharacterized protein n=1 Tax=Mycolicibacterium rhodesiae (strain NBB3) TaxID=710685 RepID=G8RLQ4_MYCRN|nr:hypothetical protein MycrhN_4378 [Mycolicibacterium rhodesiae NBB3]